MSDEVKQRKAEHVQISLAHDISAPQAASWADVRLIHQATPEVNLDEIDFSVEYLGRQLRYPIFISSLTGGHPDVAIINERLGVIAQEYGLAMGVGSAHLTPRQEAAFREVLMSLAQPRPQGPRPKRKRRTS